MTPTSYEVRGVCLFPTQIVVTKELDPEKYAGLRILSKNAREEDIETFLKQASGRQSQGTQQNIDAILQVSIAANPQTYQRMKERNKTMCEAIRTLMKEEIQEERERGIAEGEARGKAEGRAEGIAEGKAVGIAEGKVVGIAEGKAVGIAEGKAVGKAEGKVEEQKRLAANLFKEGMDISFIARVIKVKDAIVAQWLGLPMPQPMNT